jgi:hypothetical protein
LGGVAGPLSAAVKKEVPTFHEWFTDRFWREWVVGPRNKHTEVMSKQYIDERHLKRAFGELGLETSALARWQRFAPRSWGAIGWARASAVV